MSRIGSETSALRPAKQLIKEKLYAYTPVWYTDQMDNSVVNLLIISMLYRIYTQLDRRGRRTALHH
jgi:hypothetical protein